MKIKIFLFSLLVAAIALNTSSAHAQQKQQQEQKKDKKITNQQIGAEEEKVNTGTELEDTQNVEADSEMSPEAGEFVYKENGRRDPFWDMLLGKSTKLRKEAKEGIEGLEMEQLDLEGIVNRKGKYIALFKGPDGKPYDVQVGQSVYDGEIIEINANCVVFKKILTIALGGTREKAFIKWLNPPEKEKE